MYFFAGALKFFPEWRDPAHWSAVYYALHIDMCIKPAARLLRQSPALMTVATAVVEMNGPAIRFPVHGTKATGAGGVVRRPPPLAPASFEELVSFDGCLEHGAADGSGPAGSPLSVDGVCEEPPRPLQPVIGGLVVEALGLGTRVEALPDVVRAQPGGSEFPVANLAGPGAGVDYEADSAAEPPSAAPGKGVSGALLPLRPADAVSHPCSEGFAGDDCTSPASSPPQEDEPVAWASIDTGGAGEKKGGGLGQTTCAFMAAISVDKWFAVAAAAASRRLALAVFVAALAPAEASGVFYNRAELKAAVDDLATAEATHGPIAGWDVSRVDDMSLLFLSKTTFNDDIGAWDTSQVTNMLQTFWSAEAFNSELAWDTSRVTNMGKAFDKASAFNQALEWDTSRVTNLHSAFYTGVGAVEGRHSSFNSQLVWDTSKVTDMWRTFYAAEKFNEALAWDTSSVTQILDAFNGAEAFNQPLFWDTSSVTKLQHVQGGEQLQPARHLRLGRLQGVGHDRHVRRLGARLRRVQQAGDLRCVV